MIEIIIFKDNVGYLDHKNKLGGYIEHLGLLYEDQKVNYDDYPDYAHKFKSLITYEN